MGESDSFLEVGLWQRGVRWYSPRKSTQLMSNQPEQDATQNQTTVPLLFEIHNRLSTTQQGNWLARQTRTDLSCHTSLAQQCVPNPTVEQIRRANAWIRRAHQFDSI